MALARLISRGQSGLDAYEVSVEVHLAGGLPSLAITGLPTAAVRESKDRVRAALETCGIPVPPRRITVHLGPADIPKDGGRFDLAIALGIVKAQDQNRVWETERTEFLGELSLGGELRPVAGCIPAALAATHVGRRLIVPDANGAEASLVPNATVYTAKHLSEVIDDLEGKKSLKRAEPSVSSRACGKTLNLDDVRGHAPIKRALSIAAAGGHNLLMIGPPGSGKSMLAERLGTLLPPLSQAELLNVASIASVHGDRSAWNRGSCRPFRAPHHTITTSALVGGGARPRPGEVSLAHNGVLFLDELPEFSRAALEALREPLESGSVAISRVREQIRYPARFQLLAAMNPCPCGHFGDGSDRCRCSFSRLAHYRAKVSGPLLDRFDLHVEVPQVPLAELATQDAQVCESETLIARVRRVREQQNKLRGTLNAHLSDSALWRDVSIRGEAQQLLARAQERWRLSTRSIVRVLKVARTIADIEQCEQPAPDHVAEALQLRRLDRPLTTDTV